MSTDAELDLEFQSNNNNNNSVGSSVVAPNKPMRPQSTLARAFADQLNDIFLLDDQLDALDKTINRKKQSVSYQSSELALLEARIKQAERLLEEKQQRLSASKAASQAPPPEKYQARPPPPPPSVPTTI